MIRFKIYQLFFYLISPFLILRLLWKARLNPAYRERIPERFSWDHRKALPVDIWLHAVSLGEAVAAVPLIDAFLKSNHRVLVTTLTPGGSDYVLKRFGGKLQHQYLPYDLSCALRRFFRAYRPRLGIIMETEIWPNLFLEAQNFKIPLMIANARISDKAFHAYYSWRWFFKPVLNQAKWILAQSALDETRFLALGADPARVKTIGNLKFDIQSDALEDPFFQNMKARWGSLRVVLIAASTHAHEEEEILQEFKKLQALVPEIVLLLAPRHRERFQDVYALAQRYSDCVGLRTMMESINASNEVIVLDSLGELASFYHLVDYAFVGGSWVPIGGHNILEPMALSIPVFCGPHMQNSRSIVDELTAAKGLVMVASASELVHQLHDLHTHKEKRDDLVAKAKAVLDANKGSVQQHINYALNLLDSDVL